MSKSLSAKVMSDLLKLWPKYTKEECEESLAEELQKGEKPTEPPFNLQTRYEDNENGRLFYINQPATHIITDALEPARSVGKGFSQPITIEKTIGICR